LSEGQTLAPARKTRHFPRSVLFRADVAVAALSEGQTLAPARKTRHFPRSVLFRADGAVRGLTTSTDARLFPYLRKKKMVKNLVYLHC